MSEKGGNAMADQTMEARMAMMEKEIERLKAIEAIRKLEHARIPVA